MQTCFCSAKDKGGEGSIMSAQALQMLDNFGSHLFTEKTKMWPHYSQEGGYLKLAADANSVNTYTYKGAYINMEIYAKNKN